MSAKIGVIGCDLRERVDQHIAALLAMNAPQEDEISLTLCLGTLRKKCTLLHLGVAVRAARAGLLGAGCQYDFRCVERRGRGRSSRRAHLWYKDCQNATWRLRGAAPARPPLLTTIC